MASEAVATGAETGGDIELRELGTRRARLSENDASWLQRTHGRHISVIREQGADGAWLLRAGRVCGVIALPSGRRLYIEPKVPVRNVWTLLAAAGETECLKWPPGTTETLPGLVDGLTAMFVREVETLLDRGVAIGYRPTECVLPCVRGRIDVHRQVRELPARPDRFACSFAEFSRETPENRVLAAALHVVMRGPDRDLRARAARCLREIGCEVARPLQPHEPAAARVSAATRHYRVPLALARLLLEGMGAGHRAVHGFHPAKTPSLLVEMPRLFERFVCRTLDRGLPPGSRVRSTGHSIALDDGSHTMLTPDAVVEGLCGPLCVVDAKYKPEPTDRHEPSSSDLYQMLAYCVGYGVRHAILVYPRPVDVAPVRIKRDGFSATIHLLGIDLGADAHTLCPRGEVLCAQVGDIAGLRSGQSGDRPAAATVR